MSNTVWVEALARAPLSERGAVLEALVVAEFRAWLLMSDADALPLDESYFALGLTSLGAVEIQNDSSRYWPPYRLGESLQQPDHRSPVDSSAHAGLAEFFLSSTETARRQGGSGVRDSERQQTQKQLLNSVSCDGFTKPTAITESSLPNRSESGPPRRWLHRAASRKRGSTNQPGRFVFVASDRWSSTFSLPIFEHS